MQTPRRKLPDPSILTKHLTSYLQKTTKIPVYVTVLSLFFLALFVYSEDIRSLSDFSLSQLRDDVIYSKIAHEAYTYAPIHKPHPKRPALNGSKLHVHVPDTCDLTVGKWVFDNESSPIYYEEECRFLTEQVTCMRNGRRDELYQQWRWQPNECNLPRFEPLLLLNKLRNKRLMFVGDSLNRNQWESMVCLVQSELKYGKKRVRDEGSRSIFRSEEYNATIEFYWAPFLVESNSDNPKIHSIATRIIKAESIEKHAKHWKDVDYLVFNTYIWWMNTRDMKIMRPNATNWKEHDEVLRIKAYGRVLKTWSNWIKSNIDPKKTTIFFMSISPLHISPHHWNNPNGIKCALETEPYLNFTERLYVGSDPEMFNLVSNITQSMHDVPVSFIDITRMSEYRKDAHTSVYTVRQGKLLTPAQQKDLKSFADCIHWCLPGVPDTWNQILYAKIVSKGASL